MTERKRRLTVTVDPELIQAGQAAVARGEADSLSGWVGDALADRARHDAPLESLRIALADYEAEFGEISASEVAAVRRADRRSAVVAGLGIELVHP